MPRQLGNMGPHPSPVYWAVAPFTGSYFCPQQKGTAMRTKKSKQLFSIVLVFENDMTRTVKVRAVSREVAERRAMKRNPSAKGVKRSG